MEQAPLSMEDSAEHVIQYYADMVYRLAFARTGSKYDADDIFQEVFLRYVKKHPAFTGEEHRKAWLLRVTINCSNKFFRTFRRSREQERTKPANNTNEAVSFTEEMEELHAQLCRLPQKYREVIHLFYYEDMPVEEISHILNRKNSTVRTQLTRARAMLRIGLEEKEDE